MATLGASLRGTLGYILGGTLGETLGESNKITTRSEVGTELGYFVRSLEGNALGTDLGGAANTALLEGLGET